MPEISPPSSLLIQGWTGINHSYAMVNQYQLLELSGIPGLDLYTEEMPLFDQRWSQGKNSAGFSDAEAERLAAIKKYAGEPVSGVYRIHSPNTLAPADVRVVTFLVTEFGLDSRNFTESANVKSYVADGNLIVTPSNWSRERVIEYGFDAQSVYVVPHGVASQNFAPASAQERRAARALLGYTDDDVVFLNVGAPIWNKGMDLVLQAYFATRQRHKNVRLLIKDQQALYGLSAVNMIKDMVASGKIVMDNDSVESIRVLPQTLSIEQLRSLYNIADYYLSPYRAEGFNLPVIEAIACGTKAIVTQGGSTDDFCDANTAIKIPSVHHTNALVSGTHIGAYLQPDLDALVEIMGVCASQPKDASTRMAFGRADMLEQFTWKRAAALLTSLF